jgi:hypothetical protein
MDHHRQAVEELVFSATKLAAANQLVTGSIYVQQVKDGICSAIRASVSAA